MWYIHLYLNTRYTIDTIVSKGDLSFVKAIEKDRVPTPSELHLHVHTHGHDEKSFVDERSQIVHVIPNHWSLPENIHITSH